MKKIPYKIYALLDPRNGDVRYVGMSAAVDARYHSHLHTPSYEPAKYHWIHELRGLNLRPNLLVLGSAGNKIQAMALEAQFIHHYIIRGANLVNHEVVKAVAFDQIDGFVQRLTSKSLTWSYLNQAQDADTCQEFMDRIKRTSTTT